MSLISVENLGKDYLSPGGRVAALRDVSFQVSPGDFAGIIGPSGCGKSTLLGILGGLAPPTSGKVIVDGMDIYNLGTESLARFRNQYVGFVFQDFQLIPYLTAMQNVMLPLLIGGLSRKEQKDLAGEALEKVGLAGKEDRLPDQLSGGERQRTAIARAISNAPPIMLADEPTGALDSERGSEMMDLFKMLNEEGQSVIMVTHNRENLKYTGKVYVMKDGTLVREVAADDLD